MTTDAKFLRELQDHTEAKLLSEPVLNYVAVVSMRKQMKLDVAKRSAPHLAGRNGKVGAGIRIGLPSADPMDADIPGAQFTAKLPIEILVQDDVALVLSNGANITAEEVLHHVWQLLHQFANQYLGSGNFYVNGFDPIEDEKGAYGYLLVLEVRRASDEPAKCVNVITALAGGNATLACGTAGAAIYYTLDGTFPGPGNAAAVLYAAPFAVVSGQTLLTAAYKANYIGSDVWATNIP